MAVKNVLEMIRSNQAFLPVYLQAMSLLNETFVLDFLMLQGRVKEISPTVPNYINAEAAELNRSIGYNKCLQDLINFKEFFLEASSVTTPGPMDFGATDKLEQTNDITKEEADALRRNEPIPQLRPISTNTGKTK